MTNENAKDNNNNNNNNNNRKVRSNRSHRSWNSTRRPPPKNPLLTDKAIALSLSPPRGPPFETVERSILLQKAIPSWRFVNSHQLAKERHGMATTISSHISSHNKNHSSLVQQERLMQHQLQRRSKRHHNETSNANPLHLQLEPSKSLLPSVPLHPARGDRITRWLGGTVLPVEWQHRFRDAGGFQTVCDALVEGVAVPMAALTHPTVAVRFLQLSRRMERIHYGHDHASQFIDVLFPAPNAPHSIDGMLLFVHGGAWGSGKPWYYRLVADSFLQQNMAVANIGYRVYPTGSVQEQVDDLQAAYECLSKRFPSLCGPSRRQQNRYGLLLMGHSSGAHIALLWLVDQILAALKHKQHPQQRPVLVDRFVGLSGPYDISHHYDYEASRGVEELSPMKAANGHTWSAFSHYSPAQRLHAALAADHSDESQIHQCFPPHLLLVHGMEDETVPFTATAEVARLLRQVGLNPTEYYAPSTSHEEAVVQWMMGGGRVRDEVWKWLEQTATTTRATRPSRLLQSKL